MCVCVCVHNARLRQHLVVLLPCPAASDDVTVCSASGVDDDERETLAAEALPHYLLHPHTS